ncbi:hypothetical protein HY249_02785 [Candidatus Azambacteria bacterium]|nr:hypothetical protein [Candidatus Azambacteria bacterium]
MLNTESVYRCVAEGRNGDLMNALGSVEFSEKGDQLCEALIGIVQKPPTLRVEYLSDAERICWRLNEHIIES